MISERSHIKEKEFYRSVEKWIGYLYAHVFTLKPQGKEVILVAVARKMPRLIQSLCDSAKLSLRGKIKLRRILDNTDYVTEHALPFVYANRDEHCCETILIDDTIVLGNTIRTVADDIISFSGKNPLIIPIFTSVNVYQNFYLPISVYGVDALKTSRAIQQYHRMVDEVIQNNALPMDVEFPILRYDTPCAAELYDHISWGWYTSQDRKIRVKYKTENSTCMLLSPEFDWMVMNPFSKLRLFRQKHQVCMAMFSPQTLADARLYTDELFDTPWYNDLWQIIVGGLYREEIDLKWGEVPDRIAKTLVVWANYLLSLSKFNGFAKRHLQEANEFKISFQDIRLLIGQRLAAHMTDLLNNLVRRHKETGPLMGKIKLPDKIVPKFLTRPYESMRTLIWLEGIDGSVSETLQNIFDTMNYTNGVLARTLSSSEKNRSGVYETYESLLNLLEGSPRRGNTEMELNEWIDMKVDDGYLVPSYQPVRSESGQRWWKRCFSYSKSTIEL